MADTRLGAKYARMLTCEDCKNPGYNHSLTLGWLLAGGAGHSARSVVQSAGMSTESRHELLGIPDFPADQRTPAVALLLEHCHRQQEQIQALRDEIARLKGQKPKPVIRPSALEGERTGRMKVRRPKPRGKRSKTAELDIHESVNVQPAEAIPPNSRLKGYRDFVVQGLRIGVCNTRYRLERWATPYFFFRRAPHSVFIITLRASAS